MKKILSALLISSLISVAASAKQDPLKAIKAQNPSASDYEVLEKLYQTSPVPASFADIDKIDATNSNMKCAAVVSEKYPVSGFARIAKMTHVLVPAIPARGPLFPGTPAKVRTVFMNDSVFTAGAEIAEIFAAAQEITTTQKDLKITILNMPRGFGDAGNTLTMNIRKNQNYLSFNYTKRSAKEIYANVYGYCWRE